MIVKFDENVFDKQNKDKIMQLLRKMALADNLTDDENEIFSNLFINGRIVYYKEIEDVKMIFIKEIEKERIEMEKIKVGKFDEVKEVANKLKESEGNKVLVDLSECENNVRIRIIDFLAGLVYYNGSMEKKDKDTFLVSLNKW